MTLFHGEVYVATRLNQWAAWAARRDDHGLGYPKACPTVRLMPRSGGGEWSPELNTKAYEVEQCVNALSADRKMAIMQEYRYTGTHEQKARACGCSRNTYYARISAAHRDIYEYLLDLSVGTPLPVHEVDKIVVDSY